MLRIFLNRRAILPVLAALFALLASAPAWALTTGQLRLTVVDDVDSLPVPGVTVVLSSEVLIGGAQERETDQNGQILFAELPPGKYDIDLATQSGGSAKVTGIQVNVNNTTNFEVAMKTSEIEEVVIIAKTKAVDTESTSRGTILTKEFLNKVPAGRDYQSAVSLAAGVTGSGGNKNMAGGATNENTYMLDGANITDPVTGTFSLNFNFDAIQQIEVLLGGYMPEYGTSIGGIVNIVTESGTNNLEFQANAFYNNGNFYPRYDERLAADGINIAPTDFDSQFELITISSKISGPIIRDKAWFIISYQSARSVIANIGVPQARDYEGHYVLTKLTWQPTPEHRFTGFMQTDPTVIDNIDQSGPFIKADSQGRQTQGGFVLNGRWQWFLSPEVNLDTAILTQKSFLEVAGVPCTHDRTRDWNPCKPDEPDGYVDFETPGHIGVGGAYNSVNWGTFDFDDRYRFNASTRLSVLSIDDPFGGTHDMKFGAEGSQLVWDRVVGYSGNTLYVDINEIGYDPQTFKNYYWQEITGPIKFRTTAAEYNVFAQDSWKPVSNLTINYGSRLDSFVVRNDIGEPVLTGTLLGPRLFGAWDPWGDQKTKVATGFGRFNDTGRLGVANYVSTNSFGSKLFLGELFTDGAGGGFLNSQQFAYYNTPKDNLNTAYEDIRSPRVDELILILERELVEDLAAYSSMSGKFTRFGYEQDDRNLVFDSDGSAVIGSRLADPNTFYGRLRTPLLAKRDYFQWDLGLRKVEARRWAAEAVYTYTQSIGSSSSALSGAFAVDPQTQYNYGPLNTDLTHVFKAAAFWDIPTDPWTQTVGFVFQYYDGYPEERFYSADNAIDFGSVRIAPRGKYLRFNPWWFLSLNFQQAIDVRKGVVLLTFQAHNVFNNHSPEIGNGGYVDDQNRMVTAARQEPLRLEFGVGYEF